MGGSGFTSVSLRHIKSLEKIVCIARRAGADIIEWGGDVHVKNPADAKEAYKLCRENGIRISSYGSYYRVGTGGADMWQKVCETAAAMKAGTVRVWLGNRGSSKTTPEIRERLLNDALYVCTEAEKYSLTVSAECHPNTYNDDTDAFLSFAEELGRNNFKTYFQSRYRALGYDFDRIVRTFPLIDKVHISYSERVKEQLLGKKDPDYIRLLAGKLGELGYKGDFILEFTYFGSPHFLISDMRRFKDEMGGAT